MSLKRAKNEPQNEPQKSPKIASKEPQKSLILTLFFYDWIEYIPEAMQNIE